MKYYVDQSNNYIGGVDDILPAPLNSTEVPLPPEDARQKWNGSVWLPLTPQQVIDSTPFEMRDLVNVLISKGVISPSDVPTGAQGGPS